MGVFTVIALITASAVLGGRFHKRNEEARKVAKGIARDAALKMTQKWLD